MKHIAKTSSFFKTKVLPMALVVLLVAATVSVAFTVSAFNTSAVTGNKDVPIGTLANSQAKDAFWVDAEYFDYLSDAERENGYLNPNQAGTGFNGADDDWYPFKKFNNQISNASANVQHPLYFGNYCDNHDAYPFDLNEGNITGRETHNGTITKNDKTGFNLDYLIQDKYNGNQKLKNFNYLENDSNALKDLHTAVQGIAANSLDNGAIKNASGGKMLYFDKENLGGSAKVFSSAFPFRSKKEGSVTTYSFDSEGAKDNVFFDWNGTTPKTVNYGQGTPYGVKDGLSYFMSDEQSGYGIYPFNNSAATEDGRGGNKNLDHGFGIKMEMDFKVPENGLLENGDPVKFTYTGDDDLWVYISKRDGSDSQLVLDLGGNHKKTTGTIDFNKMQATADLAANVEDKNDSKDLYIYDTNAWGSGQKVWAWGNGHNGGWFDVEQCGDFPVAKGEGGAKVNVYKVNANATGSDSSKLKDCKYFTITKAKDSWDDTPKYNGTEKSAIENTADRTESKTDGTDSKAGIISERLNKMSYNSNPAYNLGGDVIPQVEGRSRTKDFGFTRKTRAADSEFKNLDPNEVYHMTIFYMERGLIESNCSMAFTMTPAQNELEVTNKVEIEGVNPAESFKADVEDIVKNDNFHYDVTDTNKPLDADLKDGERTGDKFNNKYPTGAKINVNETYDTIYKYKTDWQVVDVADNENVIAKSPDGTDSKKTDDFDFVNKNSDIDPAKMRVDYHNVAVCAPLEITKEIVNPEGQPVTEGQEFAFTMKVDVRGGTDYKAYPLMYSTDPTAGQQMSDTGQFTFNSSDTVTVMGLPVGSSYEITETDADGYTPVEPVITGKIEEESNNNPNQVKFTNRENPTEPPTTVEPTTEEPTTEEPTTEEPTTEEPTTEPTEPTTVEPTTVEPTTESPIQPPTTEEPTTEEPTTEPTEPPTTEPPTTVAPTTVAPTTVAPTTEAPTTEPPTTAPVTEAATESENTPEINKRIVNSKFTEFYSTAAFDETVTFKLDAKITGSKTRKLNEYTIVDTMSEGFTFDKVKTVTLDTTKKLNSSEYSVKMTDEGFEVSLAKSVLEKDEFYDYNDVIVTYTAKLNKNAVIGAEGNPNSDSLKWVDADNVSHTKEGNEVVVYTFQIDVNKVDSTNDDPLEGVKFGLYSSENDAKNDKNAIAHATSDDEGLASFPGLDKGTYYVRETKSIKGYNLNTKVYKVKIAPKFSGTKLTSPDDGSVSVTIKNTPSKLPKTGMMSTVMFTIIGGLLIGGAGVLFLIASRKKSYKTLSHLSK